MKSTQSSMTIRFDFANIRLKKVKTAQTKKKIMTVHKAVTTILRNIYVPIVQKLKGTLIYICTEEMLKVVC